MTEIIHTVKKYCWFNGCWLF